MDNLEKLKVGDNSWILDNTPSTKDKSMFYYVQEVGHFYCSPDYYVDRSNYNTMLVLFSLDGKGYLKYKDKEYTLNKGEGFIIDCMEYHYYGSDKNDLWNMIWMHFNGCESKDYVKRINDNNGPVFSMEISEKKPDNIIIERIKRIYNMIKNKDHKLNIVASKYIVEILTCLLLNGIKSENNLDKYQLPSVVRHCINQIEQYYFKTSISLDELSNNIGVSKYHLSRLFKKFTGYSPYEYLMNYRINESKKLLKTTNLPVYQIAERVGFNSSSHFIKIFKKNEEVTPLQFRNYRRQ